MESLPNNSGKDKQNVHEHRVEKVVTGEVKHRKTFGKLLRDSFVPADVENAGAYIVTDMIIPGIRDGVFDILRGILDYWAGGVGGPTRRNNSRITSRFDYNSRYNNRTRSMMAGGPPESSQSVSKFSYDDIVVPSLQEAEEVIASMKDIIRMYQVVRVADLFDLVGVTGSYTDNNFGWVNLDKASYQRVSGGWLLIFPKAMPIED